MWIAVKVAFVQCEPTFKLGGKIIFSIAGFSNVVFYCFWTERTDDSRRFWVAELENMTFMSAYFQLFRGYQTLKVQDFLLQYLSRNSVNFLVANSGILCSCDDFFLNRGIFSITGKKPLWTELVGRVSQILLSSVLVINGSNTIYTLSFMSENQVKKTKVTRIWFLYFHV